MKWKRGTLPQPYQPYILQNKTEFCSTLPLSAEDKHEADEFQHTPAASRTNSAGCTEHSTSHPAPGKEQRCAMEPRQWAKGIHLGTEKTLLTFYSIHFSVKLTGGSNPPPLPASRQVCPASISRSPISLLSQDHTQTRTSKAAQHLLLSPITR